MAFKMSAMKKDLSRAEAKLSEIEESLQTEKDYKDFLYSELKSMNGTEKDLFFKKAIAPVKEKVEKLKKQLNNQKALIRGINRAIEITPAIQEMRKQMERNINISQEILLEKKIESLKKKFEARHAN